ncbi:MAG: hypothetical protein DRQ55_04245 [Planctomycetota bacterium]|nr:MAG: hypothetical protein DRQ55_04245 [Planctomycetota bacterium]
MFVLVLAGCSWSVTPALPPVSPPPNVPENVLLMTVPARYLKDVSSPLIEQHLLEEMLRFQLSEPARAADVLRHEVRTGMTAQHLVWSFLSHPTRVVDQGPPGGHTLLWGPGGVWSPGRYWVRLDSFGQVVSAGRY